MKNRWIALYVENDVGVLAKVSGLFSGKSYNLQSLTVGTTEDETVSRMTICVTSDDITFEQIKKQLNRMVEVIKVIDLTDVPLHMKEILFAKVLGIDAAGTAQQRADRASALQVPAHRGGPRRRCGDRVDQHLLQITNRRIARSSGLKIPGNASCGWTSPASAGPSAGFPR